MDPVTFDLRGLHIGDVVMTLPATRAGDAVVIEPKHRVPFAELVWLDKGEGLRHERAGIPQTAHWGVAWHALTGRRPKFNQLMEVPRRDGLVVLAPDTNVPSKMWTHWRQLERALAAQGLEVEWIRASAPRESWMRAMASASVVVAPDNGSMHMADALGVPRVVGLFGAGMAQAMRYRPTWAGLDHCAVERGIDNITVRAVQRAVNGESVWLG